MTIKEINQAVYKQLADDDLLSSPGFCRYAAEKLFSIAQSADKTPPHATISIMVYPDATLGENVHYCLQVANPEEGAYIVNTVRTALFPEYNGPKEQAPGFFSRMKETNKVV